MKTLESGKLKLKQISDSLFQDAIEPAKKEAAEILQKAETERQKIIQTAKEQAEAIVEEAKTTMTQEKKVVEASLKQAAKQSMDALKQALETKLINREITSFVQEGIKDKKLLAKLIEALIGALEKDGLAADFSLILPKTLSRDELSKLLLAKVMKSLEERPVEVGKFGGGVRVKLQAKNVTLDFSDEALEDMLRTYLRQDLFEKLFSK